MLGEAFLLMEFEGHVLNESRFFGPNLHLDATNFAVVISSLLA